MEEDFKELKAFVHANVEKLGINFTQHLSLAWNFMLIKVPQLIEDENLLTWISELKPWRTKDN